MSHLLKKDSMFRTREEVTSGKPFGGWQASSTVDSPLLSWLFLLSSTLCVNA